MTDTKYIKLETPCRLSVTVGGDLETLTGYLVKRGGDLQFFAKFTDWSFSGLTIIQTKQANTVDEDDSLIFFDRVIKALKEPEIRIPSNLLLAENLQQVFEYAANSKDMLAIEGNGEDEFEVIRVLATSDNCAITEVLDPDGSWQSKNVWIKLANIAQVTFFDPYCLGIQNFLDKNI